MRDVSRIRLRGKNFNAEQVVRIVDASKDMQRSRNQDYYNVIISHPDEDHYNLLPDIVKKCRKRGLEPYKIFLGGVRALYSEAFQTFLDELTEKPDESESSSDEDSDEESSRRRSVHSDEESDGSSYSSEESDSRNESEDCSRSSSDRDDQEETNETVEVHVPIVTYLTEKGKTKTLVPIEEGMYLTYGILPALQATTEAQKNDGSLAVLIEYEGLSFLVAGDATDATTEHILRYYPHLKVDGLHGSHHGGESDGSNSARWLRKLAPKAIVFSSGVNTKYRHPRGAILDRARKYLPDVEGPYHALYSGTTKKGDFNDTFYNGIGSNGYGLSATPQHIYDTLGQGTMKFTLDPSETSLGLPKCSLGLVTYPDKKSCVLESLLKSPANILPLDILVTLDISRLGIDDDEIQDKDRIRRLLKLLKEEGFSLHNLFMQDNAINRPLTITYVEELLDTRKYVQLFDMRRNGLATALKKQLLKKASKRRTCKL